MTKTSRASRLLFWIAAVIGGVILFHQINFRGYLATGDHGWNLYAFERTLHGDVPYQDYWWIYGPIMPYYYALFDHAFGVNIQSILIGKTFLTFASGMLVFMTLETLGGALAALSGSVWFFVFWTDFFYTDNHAGGITCLLLLFYSMARYIVSRRDDWLWVGVLAAFLLAMVKLNFGVIGIGLLVLTAYLTDRVNGLAPTERKTFFHTFSLFILPALIALVYFMFLYGLHPDEIFQCLPYADADHALHTTVWQAMMSRWHEFVRVLLAYRTHFIFGTIVLLSTFRVFCLLFDQTMPAQRRKNWFLVLGLFGLAYALTMHEFLKSGAFYRLPWAYPAGMIWMFTVIAMAVSGFSRFVRTLVFGVVLVLAFGWSSNTFKEVDRLRTNDHYFSHPKARVFIANDQNWMNTVETTTAWLEQMVPTNETFFALPYDPLYYYLTGRKSPTRQLIFFDFINVSPRQEAAIIQDLETARVNFVLISNRMYSHEDGLGFFGSTYCPALARYISANFIPVAKFGDWSHEGGWADAHGTLILQRKGLRK